MIDHYIQWFDEGSNAELLCGRCDLPQYSLDGAPLGFALEPALVRSDCENNRFGSNVRGSVQRSVYVSHDGRVIVRIGDRWSVTVIDVRGAATAEDTSDSDIVLFGSLSNMLEMASSQLKNSIASIPISAANPIASTTDSSSMVIIDVLTVNVTIWDASEN